MIIIKETKTEWDKWVIVPVKVVKRKAVMGKLADASSALCQFSADILQYVSLVFASTGIYTFHPELLMKCFDTPIETSGMTIEQFWQQCFIPIALVLIILKIVFWTVSDFDISNFAYEIRNIMRHSEENKTMNVTRDCSWYSQILVRLVSMVLAAIVIFYTGFDGDRLLWTFAFWILINLITNYLTKEKYITGMPKEVTAKTEGDAEQTDPDEK